MSKSNRNLTKIGQYSPKEAAISITLGWIAAAYRDGTADLEAMDNRPSMHRAIRKQLAKIHNKLLDTTRMDGMYIGEEG